ncbi:MAG: CPBP family intramembrane metalloprotease [Cyclobacteriaceae bacterium]|nr:CPBP family intramembrane metalloprotease [Cyclobacteriaceae bacterium]
MKKIIHLVKQHIQQDFKPLYYGAIFILLAVSITVNYTLNLENGIIDQHTGKWIRVFYYYLLYAFGYYATCLAVSAFHNNHAFWKSKTFWILSTFGLTILSADRGFPYLHKLAMLFNQPYEAYSWLFRTLNHATGFIIIFLSLWLFYRWVDKEKSGFYGLTKPGNIKPYVYLLLIVAPAILIAALHTSFINYYPVYKSTHVAGLWGWPGYMPALIFELLYGLDFLNVELLFRGFFVIGLAQVLGKDAIMPMVTIYCYLHFGKPIGETISSIAGGYILGAIALYTRSVWGGVFIHVGVAWLMELSAWLVKQL